MEVYRKALTVWYNHTKRELPWRESQEPYKIWVSEVILQQTRVSQGTSYYHNFLQLFPDIKSLAAATEDEVLKAWQGLGYYSRARNMHQAAKSIQLNHGGKFPDDYPSIRRLNGIGDYTAAAIASISFNLPYAVVDGNVYRVLSRLFGISTPIDSTVGKKEFSIVAQMMLDKKNPGEFNQAIMEFGALQCVPAQPLCSDCPLSPKCHAYANQTIEQFPVKSKQAKQKNRYFNYLFLHQDHRLFLEKRIDKGIWRNLYQFPLIETAVPAPPEEIINSREWNQILGDKNYSIDLITPERIHILTHQILHLRFFSISLSNEVNPEKLISVKSEEVSRYPVPKPVADFLEEMGH